MINYHKELVAALKTILPTHYEMVLTSGLATPCISYMETNNYSNSIGDTVGVSTVVYQIKVWGTDIGDLQTYALAIDNKLRPLGFKRISTGELYDNNSSMMQKIMSYQATGLEEYTNN